MKKMKKMNNKGFSLVELIIVIAIMAILAGALAPALLRYIEKTRVSNDKSTAANLKTAVETALANEEVMDAVSTKADGTNVEFLSFEIETTNAGAKYPDTCPDALENEIAQTLASSKMKIKSKKDLEKKFVVAIAFGAAGEADVVEVYLVEKGKTVHIDTQGVKISQAPKRTDLIPTKGGANPTT